MRLVPRPYLPFIEACAQHIKPELQRQPSLELWHTVSFSGTKHVMLTCHHHWLPVGHCKNIWGPDKGQRNTLEVKHAKDSKGDQTRRTASGTSVAVNRNNAFYHMRPHHKFYDTAGYRKFPLIWKVRECMAWGDESGLLWLDHWLQTNSCMKLRALRIPPYGTSLVGGWALALFLLKIQNLANLGAGAHPSMGASWVFYSTSPVPIQFLFFFKFSVVTEMMKTAFNIFI